jgi:hypothetical protein
MAEKFNRMLRTALVFLMIVIVSVCASGCSSEEEEYLVENPNSLVSQELKVDQDLGNGRSMELTSHVPIDRNVPEGLETATLALG